jgi:hypothetical protein
LSESSTGAFRSDGNVTRTRNIRDLNYHIAFAGQVTSGTGRGRVPHWFVCSQGETNRGSAPPECASVPSLR